MTITVSRAYDHKAFGRMGVATLEASADKKGEITFTLNGQALPPAGVDHLLTFALQSLQDAYAGAADKEDAQARFDGKLARILDGTIGTRAAGGGVSAIMAEIRTLLRPQVKAAHGDDWKGLEEADRVAAIDAIFEAQPETVREQLEELARAEIARKAAEKAAKAGLLGSLNITL